MTMLLPSQRAGYVRARASKRACSVGEVPLGPWRARVVCAAEMALLRRVASAEASRCCVGCCVAVELELDFEDPAAAESSVKDVIWEMGMMR
jgi:hypothetical protein